MIKILQKITHAITFYSKESQKEEFNFHQTRLLQKKFDDIDPYLDLMDDVAEKLSILTAFEIKPLTKLCFGSSPAEAKRKLGKPFAAFIANGLLQTDVLIFNTRYMGYKARLELSYYQQMLFGFSCYFEDAENEDKNLILGALETHYQIRLNNPQIQKIIDNTGNTISISETENFQLHFFFTDHPLFTELKNIAVFYNRNKHTASAEMEKAIYHSGVTGDKTAKPVGL